MKNKFLASSFLLIILSAGSGCGVSEQVQKAVTETANSSNSNVSNKAIVDKAIDTAIGGEKIGVRECDELYDYVADLVTKSENENFATKAARQYFLNRIRERIKTSVEQNKNDKVQLAKDCRDYRRQIDAFMNQQPNEQK
ncbi:MAG TPA: hypothetical protein VF556_17260 [Pyrinomonadaceae bacterium]|jgi:glutaredoxin 2